MSASLRFAPMPLAALHEPFDHDDFIFELKYDGFRALADVESGRGRLISRNHHEFTTLPELCTAIGQALHGQFVLDGEIVYLAKDGCPRFCDLMRRRAPQYFYAFDLLWKDGRDLRGLPLIKRKRLLKKIVSPRCCLWITWWAVESICFRRYARGTWRESSPRQPRGCISRRRQPG